MSEDATAAVHDDLVRAGIVVPAAFGGAEERAWLDCDLASLAENRLGDRTDPRDLDEARRADWTARAVDEPPTSLDQRSDYECCYWLMDNGQRAGTMALATGTFGNRRLHMSSFYVLPPLRRKGAGRRAMTSLTAALARHRLGLRLDTSWCWQPTVRFYLALGLWVYMWKRELTLCWDGDTPPPVIEVGDQSASLSILQGGAPLVLARAHRRGDFLEIEPSTPGLGERKDIGAAYWHAHSTLALGLAMHGWPLVRSPEQWEKSHYSDGGSPEGLAYKITTWEAFARHHDRLVETPRIAGLAYPTWDQFQAQWAADRAEFELSLVQK